MHAACAKPSGKLQIAHCPGRVQMDDAGLAKNRSRLSQALSADEPREVPGGLQFDDLRRVFACRAPGLGNVGGVAGEQGGCMPGIGQHRAHVEHGLDHATLLETYFTEKMDAGLARVGVLMIGRKHVGDGVRRLMDRLRVDGIRSAARRRL